MHTKTIQDKVERKPSLIKERKEILAVKKSKSIVLPAGERKSQSSRVLEPKGFPKIPYTRTLKKQKEKKGKKAGDLYKQFQQLLSEFL